MMKESMAVNKELEGIDLLNGNFVEFLKNTKGVRLWHGLVDDINYRQISIDTRTLKKGDLFFALKGEIHDGHAYIPRAIQKGASGVVVNMDWYFQNSNENLSPEVPVVVVEDTLEFLQKLAHWHRKQFSLPVLAITGSSGKTTTRQMIVEILKQKYRVVHTEGNKNNHIGVPLSLLKIDSSDEIAVFELGTNHPGEIKFLSELTAPTAGLVTNIGKGHIGFLGSLEEVYREKSSLFQEIPADGTIFLNMEDSFLKNYQRSDVKVIRVGREKHYEVYGEIIEADEFQRITFRLLDQVDIHLNIPGRHQFLNALLSTAVGVFFNVPLADIKHALENLLPAKQRMEILEKNGLIIVNDAYNANPDSMRAAIDYVSQLSFNGKKILILGDMLELGKYSREEHQELGRYLAHHPVDYVLLYGPQSVYIKLGLETEAANVESRWFDSHRELAEFLNELVAEGDVILIKGSRGMVLEKVLDYLNWERRNDAG